MFKGSLPTDALKIIAELLESSTCQDVHIACSGNFTIERTLMRFDRFRMHSNDVSMYSCTLGRFFAKAPLNVSISPNYLEEWDWLTEYLTDPVSITATVMLCTDMLQGWGKVNAYYDRLRGAYRAQWPKLHEETVEKLISSGLSVSSFHAGDAVEWVANLPKDTTVVTFPPFFAKDYEKMNAGLDDLFEWERPTYDVMTAQRRELFFSSVLGKRKWVFGTHVEQHELKEHLKGVCKTTTRGAKIFIYSDSGRMRRIGPRMECGNTSIPRLSAGVVIGADVKIRILSNDQFHILRSQYMNIKIQPGIATGAYGVFIDNVLVGCFAFYLPNDRLKFPLKCQPFVYLLSDFPVNSSDYPRLSKLIIYAALSKEAQLLAERTLKRRVKFLVTTAFSKNMVSMKYRGLMELNNRVEKKERGEWMLNYCGEFGKWTLEEGYKEWKKKHGKYEPKLSESIPET